MSTCLRDAECQDKCLDNAYDGAQDIGYRAVNVVASGGDCQGTVHCSEDYQTIVTQSSSIDYI